MVYEKIKKGKVSYTQKEWKQVTPEGINLVKQMLEIDPKKRLSVIDCLGIIF